MTLFLHPQPNLKLKPKTDVLSDYTAKSSTFYQDVVNAVVTSSASMEASLNGWRTSMYG